MKNKLTKNELEIAQKLKLPDGVSSLFYKGKYYKKEDIEKIKKIFQNLK